MDLGLDGRVAIVTAASKGLGRATAQALAAEGPRVLLTARDQAALEELGATMDDALVVPGDITDPALPGQLVDAAVQRWGRIDIVVGNAGGPPSGSALDVDDEHILAAVNANMLASVRVARAPVPHIRQQPWVVSCSSRRRAFASPSATLRWSDVARTAPGAWTKTAAQGLAATSSTASNSASTVVPSPS